MLSTSFPTPPGKFLHTPLPSHFYCSCLPFLPSLVGSNVALLRLRIVASRSLLFPTLVYLYAVYPRGRIQYNLEQYAHKIHVLSFSVSLSRSLSCIFLFRQSWFYLGLSNNQHSLSRASAGGFHGHTRGKFTSMVLVSITLTKYVSARCLGSRA